MGNSKSAGAALLSMIQQPRSASTFAELLDRAGVASRPASTPAGGAADGVGPEPDVDGHSQRSIGERLQSKLRAAERAIADAENDEDELARRRKVDAIRAKLEVYNSGLRDGEARARDGK